MRITNNGETTSYLACRQKQKEHDFSSTLLCAQSFESSEQLAELVVLLGVGVLTEVLPADFSAPIQLDPRL